MAFDREQLVAELIPILKAEGFTKTRTTWHRDSVDRILVFNVQGSQWSSDFYLNAGLYFKALGSETRPPEHRCHLRSRLSRGVDDTTSDLVMRLMGWFRAHESIAGLKQSIASRECLSTLTLQEYLGALKG